jgi:cell fate regulator YaaT (PSP1 superfamily)
MGGIGVCGRVLCCNSYLGEFQPVSIKMAKEQGLSLNPTKISGACGRLMCCLKYEQDAYEQIIKKAPKTGAVVETPDGQGVIIETYLIKEIVKVKLDKGNETDLQTYKMSEVRVIKDVSLKEDNDTELEALKELKALED